MARLVMIGLWLAFLTGAYPWTLWAIGTQLPPSIVVPTLLSTIPIAVVLALPAIIALPDALDRAFPLR